MIKVKPIRPFIAKTEALLLKSVASRGGTYFGETELLPHVYETAKDALKGNDDFIQAIRFDMETLTGEDVTEDLAECWLSDWDGDPDRDVPDFIKHSDAYEKWCAQYEIENPRWRGPDPDQQRQEWLDDEYRHQTAAE